MRDDLSTRPDALSELGPVLGELVHDLANEVQILHGWASIARAAVSWARPASSGPETMTIRRRSSGYFAIGKRWRSGSGKRQRS